MSKLLDSAGRVAGALLVALSTIGTVMAFQHFYTLGSIESALQAQQVLSDAKGTAIVDSSKGGVDRLRLKKSAQEDINVIQNSVIQAVRESRLTQQLHIALWLLIFVTSCVSLVAYRAKRNS